MQSMGSAFKQQRISRRYCLAKYCIARIRASQTYIARTIITIGFQFALMKVL